MIIQCSKMLRLIITISYLQNEQKWQPAIIIVALNSSWSSFFLHFLLVPGACLHGNNFQRFWTQTYKLIEKARLTAADNDENLVAVAYGTTGTSNLSGHRQTLWHSMNLTRMPNAQIISLQIAAIIVSSRFKMRPQHISMFVRFSSISSFVSFAFSRCSLPW